ncbi:MAG TPA: hypothetical protein VJL28_10800 [Gemmatimonadaceae bacterium]|nr:hypothetical protein [Gemmatimonadaceae bacterium]
MNIVAPVTTDAGTGISRSAVFMVMWRSGVFTGDSSTVDRAQHARNKLEP